MSFENEKDILDNSDNFSDDAISWEDVPDTGESDIVSIKNNSSSDIPTEVFSNDTGNNTDAINIEDVIADDSDTTAPVDNTINEDELKMILGADTSDGVEYIDDSEDVDADSLNEILMNDTQSSAVNNEPAASNDDDILPRKEEIKKQHSVSPILVALLFALLVSAGVYFVYTFLMNKEEDTAMQQNEQIQNTQENESIEEVTGENTLEEQNGDIPVVNEDEASDLKPEEEQLAEKKEVVSVVPTGRINHFAPLQKYVDTPQTGVIVKTINNIDVDSVKIPKPPRAYGEMTESTDKLMSRSVSGIMYDTLKPSAIINYDSNDYFVQIGDKLNNFKVVDIGPSNVKIALGKNIYKAEVGERFKIQSEFFGNNSYHEGARQYYSSEDEFNDRVNSAKKYTSNDDVIIHTKK